jgi:hypothetical protein
MCLLLNLKAPHNEYYQGDMTSKFLVVLQKSTNIFQDNVFNLNAIHSLLGTDSQFV